MAGPSACLPILRCKPDARHMKFDSLEKQSWRPEKGQGASWQHPHLSGPRSASQASSQGSRKVSLVSTSHLTVEETATEQWSPELLCVVV